MRTTCHECEASFEVGPKQARVGTLIFCPECGVELEVVNEHPLEVDLIREEFSDGWFNGIDSNDEGDARVN
mgnify:CR=1 FL=1